MTPDLSLFNVLREHLRKILERLELERIAAGIEKEHRRLLADLALEAHVRLNDEVDAGRDELLREGVPLRHGEYHAEMAHRHLIAVHRAGLPVTRFIRCEVRDNLVPIEVEIDPGIGAAAFGAAEQAAVEGPRPAEVGDGKRQMKKRG